MKRVLTFILCSAIMLGLLSPLTGFKAEAADLEQMGANQSYNFSWRADTEYKYIYLTVDETGYYDLEIEDLNGYDYGFLDFYLKDLDMDDNSYSWDNTRFWLSVSGQKSKENIYLIKDHLYEIRCQYSSDAYAYPVANIQLCFTKTDYTPIDLSLGTNKNLVVGNGTQDYLYFTTTAAGDYTLELNQTAWLVLDIFEKESGRYVDYQAFDNYSVFRVRLQANTEYMIVAAGYEDSSKVVRLNVTKAAHDITKIEAVQSHKILADEGYFDDEATTLNWSDVMQLEYQITFSDGGTSDLLDYYGLRSNGIYIYDIYYAGDVYTYGDESFFKPGSQPFSVSYMNELTSTTYIYITPYKEFVADLNSKNDYDDLYIRYNNHSDTESHTYYWRIIPNETNLYSFYSFKWDQIFSDLTIFDKDNNVVVCQNGSGWALKGGQEYCLRVTYNYKENCNEDVRFHLEIVRDHVHSYSNAWDTSCDVCDAERTVSLSKTAPTSFKATLTGYNDVKLTWKAGKGATHYYVYYRRAGKTEWKRATITTGLTYTIKDLVANGKYEFKVISYLKDSSGTYKGGSTSVLSYSTTRNLSAPSKVTLKLYGYDDVKISWSKVSNAAGYKVYYKRSTAKSYSYIGFTTGTSIKKANLSDGVKYTFKVVPCTKVNGSYFEDDSSKTASITTLKKVSTPKVTKSTSTKVKVSWTDISGESGYQIAKTSDKAGKKIVSTTTTTGKSKVITAKKGVTYYYKVRAYKTVDGKKIYAPWSAVKSYKLK